MKAHSNSNDIRMYVISIIFYSIASLERPKNDFSPHFSIVCTRLSAVEIPQQQVTNPIHLSVMKPNSLLDRHQNSTKNPWRPLFARALRNPDSQHGVGACEGTSSQLIWSVQHVSFARRRLVGL